VGLWPTKISMFVVVLPIPSPADGHPPEAGAQSTRSRPGWGAPRTTTPSAEGVSPVSSHPDGPGEQQQPY